MIVFVAMFLNNMPWIQILIYVMSSFFMCCFIRFSWPFQLRGTNSLELFNEIMILAVGILAMAYLGVVKESEPHQGYALGEMVSWIIIIQIVTNLVIIIYGLFYKAKLYLKRAYRIWQYKRHMKRIEAEYESDSEDESESQEDTEV